jgi:hypothetical protein
MGVVLAGACFAAGLVCCAGGWRALLTGDISLVDACARFGCGSLANTFLPARGGDIVRIGLFARVVPGGAVAVRGAVAAFEVARWTALLPLAGSALPWEALAVPAGRRQACTRGPSSSRQVLWDPGSQESLSSPGRFRPRSSSFRLSTSPGQSRSRLPASALQTEPGRSRCAHTGSRWDARLRNPSSSTASRPPPGSSSAAWEPRSSPGNEQRPAGPRRRRPCNATEGSVRRYRGPERTGGDPVTVR